MHSPAEQLRHLLARPRILTLPGCYDAISAKVIERGGFEAGFMSGFAVSAARLAQPDTGVISAAELIAQGRDICTAVEIPILGDGDTGFGNGVNVKRTVREYARAGFACIMIEDQVMPKRCGHTRGKEVVGREEACARIQAAVDARNEGADILVMARTDASACLGLDEAIGRCCEFHRIGADITFLEAPLTQSEMAQYCNRVPGYKMANMVEQGKTPILPSSTLEAMGYKIAVYPLTLLNVSIGAMQSALDQLGSGESSSKVMDFTTLQEVVGFPDYYAEEARYRF